MTKYHPEKDDICNGVYISNLAKKEKLSEIIVLQYIKEGSADFSFEMQQKF